MPFPNFPSWTGWSSTALTTRHTSCPCPSPAYPPRTPSIFCKTTASAFPPVPPVPRVTAAMCWKPWGCLRRSWTAPSVSPCAGTPPPRSWTLSFRSSGRRSFPGQDDAFQSSDSACADRRFRGKCNHATKKLQIPLVFSARFCYNSGILIFHGGTFVHELC